MAGAGADEPDAELTRPSSIDHRRSASVQGTVYRRRRSFSQYPPDGLVGGFDVSLDTDDHIVDPRAFRDEIADPVRPQINEYPAIGFQVLS
jgi:hypothetical protein